METFGVPLHAQGSWLNIAELEVSGLGRLGLQRRIGDVASLEAVLGDREEHLPPERALLVDPMAVCRYLAGLV